MKAVEARWKEGEV